MNVRLPCLCTLFLFFYFKQKTAYEMRISDWSSDVCSSDLLGGQRPGEQTVPTEQREQLARHRGGEAGDPPIGHRRPFAMRSRLRKQCVGRHHTPRDRAEKLDFLAAHPLRAAILRTGNAGNDRGAERERAKIRTPVINAPLVCS